MGIVFRQSIKTSAVIMAGAVIGLLFTYWQTLVMPKDQIGISRNIINQGAVIQSLLLFGVHSIVHTYIQRYPLDSNKRAVLQGYSLLVPLLSSLIFAIPYWCLREWIIPKYQAEDQGHIREFYNWLPLLTLLWSYMSLIETFLLARMKVAYAIFNREVVVRLINMLLLVLYAYGYLSFYGFVVGSILAYLVPIFLLALVARKNTRLSLDSSLLEKSEIRSAVHYAWYHMLIGASLNLVNFIDSLMLAPLSGASELAVYNIAIFLISFVNIPYKAMSAAAFPKLNQAYLHEPREVMLGYFNRTNLNILVATVFTGTLLLCNIRNAVGLLPAGYESLAPVCLILMLGRLADVATGMNQELISITPHYKFTFRASVVYILLAIVCNRLLIPVYGIYGAAWSSAICLVIFNLLKAAFLKRKLGMLPFERKGLLIFPIALLTAAVSFILPQLSSLVLDTAYRSVILSVLMLVFILVLKPAPDISHYWQTIRKQKKLF